MMSVGKKSNDGRGNHQKHFIDPPSQELLLQQKYHTEIQREDNETWQVVKNKYITTELQVTVSSPLHSHIYIIILGLLSDITAPCLYRKWCTTRNEDDKSWTNRLNNSECPVMSPLTSHMASFKPFLPKKGWNSLPFILWPFRGARHTEEYQGFYFHSTLQENKVDSSGSSTPVRRATDSDVSCSSAVTTSFNVTTSSESSSAKLHCVYELKDK